MQERGANVLGCDIGTYNLVMYARDKDGNFLRKREINAFLEIPLADKIVFDMMDKTGKVPLIKREKVAYALGEKAVRMAYVFDKEFKRPMRDGCVNPKEKDAIEILGKMVQGLLEGLVTHDKEPLYYCVPANAINEETDATFHTKILEGIFKGYESADNKKVSAHAINEGLALVYAELADKDYTGIGLSFGAGMVNVCYAMFGVPVFTFAIVNSGDWIDRMAAKATGESSTFINQEKTKVDLGRQPSGIVERAIQTQYRIMVERTVSEIKRGMTQSGKKTRTQDPVDVILAGGTASPPGFDVLFKEVLSQAELPIAIGNVTRPDDPLYSVARGCLLAAECENKKA